MLIVSQQIPILYTPYLALPAPHIAGLLPAGRIESTSPTDPPEEKPTAYVFDRLALADLTTAQRDRLFNAADVLMEIAVEFAIGTFDEHVLRAAEVLFHRAAGGTSALRPVGPAAYNAEVDADWLEMIARSKQVRPISFAEAESIVNQVRARPSTTTEAGGGA